MEILTARSERDLRLRRQKNQSLADFTAADIANFWLLYTVNTAFPLFRHMFETRGGHPEELFAAMLSLAGSLTTFSSQVHPRDLPPYDHDNLGGCFSELDEKLRLLLDTVVASNVVSLPLKLLKPSIYATALDNDKYLVNTKMYLAISAETSQAEIVYKTPNLVKICSASHIEHLVRQALAGGARGVRGAAAGCHPREVQLPVFRPHPGRPGLGIHPACTQLRRLHPRRSAEPASRTDHRPAAE